MRRRDAITLLGGAAAWPLVARAQHERMHRVAMITGGSDENDPDAQANALAFEQAMHQLGWVQGRNLRINYFWGRGQPEAVRQHAADIVDQPLATRSTAAQPHHRGVGGGLVDEHQPRRVKHALVAHPAAAGAGHVRALLLHRVQSFF